MFEYHGQIVWLLWQSEQGRQLALGTVRRVVLECLPCGDHETDHRAGQIFTEYQRANNGKEGDDIHPGRAATQTVNQRAGDRNEGEPGRPGPECCRQDVVPCEPGAAAAAQAEDAG